MKIKRPLIAIILLIFTIAISYSLPAAKYTGSGFIPKLQLPETISDWRGKNITDEAGITDDIKKYDHVSEAAAYQYVNREGQKVIFIILDAQTFHHPKACFTGSGFKIKELSDMTFRLHDNSLRSHTIFTEKGKNKTISFYWVIIDKKIIHEWLEQKVKQLFSVFSVKKGIDLMVRIDIQGTEDDINAASVTAKQFIDDVRSALPQEQAEYIFGIQ